MRWERLFTDLEAQFVEMLDGDVRGELADRQRSAVGAVSLVQRCRGAVGDRIRVRTHDGELLAGCLADVGPDWLLLDGQSAAQILVALRAVTAIEGLRAASGTELTTVARRFDLRLVLRGLARDRAPVQMVLAGATTGGALQLSGTIDRVGADFIEVAQHPAWEARRATTVRSMVVIPVASLVAVLSHRLG